MKWLTFAYPEQAHPVPRLGLLLDQTVVDLERLQAWVQSSGRLPGPALPASLFELIQAGPLAWAYTRSLVDALEGADPRGVAAESGGPVGGPVGSSLGAVDLYPPLPRPMSLRDFYAFEAHVATAHANRGKEVPPEWYQFPVFYFSNPNAIFGPDEVIPYPATTRELDYELEVACIISKAGIDIPAEKAGEYIFGYTIFNDWSARDVQRLETRVGLGPAKGKDFASSLGPWVVTPDELSARAAGRTGVYDLAMAARVNGKERSRGNWKDIHYSFGEMIARASAGAYLLPGDVLGSGTVGTGCLLELTRGQGPWLQPGDRVELEVERLGVLANRVAKLPAGGAG
ncbi:MAG TPA: fumarylacetoacetate hydrolase family protein [Anaerolineales bacterium]